MFDASRKTSSGISLNEKLLVGPKLQDDLVDILLRFRTHLVAFTCDIAKMYRQVLVDESQRDFQRIVWRESTQQPIQHYVLKTVTYGTAAASYLATKSLQQLASCERENYPLASKVTLTDFYVDDIMTGCNTIEEALELQCELVEMLQSGGMELRKWSANNNKILQAVPVEYREGKLEIGFDSEEPVKTLGLYWFPGSDNFGYNVQVTSYDSLTKRKVLSEVAKLFDPLGFLAPVIISAKIFMQSLWAAGIDWDDTLPDDLAKSWINYRRDLHVLDQIKVERFLGTVPNAKYELHGFCDSSELAYGAVIYLRAVQPYGKVATRLITAKSKVAPLKKISVPRLELCGALLLARLMAHVRDSINLEVTSYTWTDSTVVLSWLRKPSHNWQTFVANRVSEIQSLAPSDTWHHVPGIQNPADCASRGLSASNLFEFDLWWHGPTWLAQASAHWPQNIDILPTRIDEKVQAHALLATKHVDTTILDGCSSLAQLARKTARVWRFINNCRLPNDRKSGNLTVKELQRAIWYWIKIAQRIEFHLELKCCKNKLALPGSSVLKKLNPFLDKNELLRVGGRIGASDLEYGIKHSIILPKSGHLSYLIISDSH